MPFPLPPADYVLYFWTLKNNKTRSPQKGLSGISVSEPVKGNKGHQKLQLTVYSYVRHIPQDPLSYIPHLIAQIQLNGLPHTYFVTIDPVLYVDPLYI